MKARGTNHGFTLIELLIVIAIIGILSSVVLAAVRDARQGAMVAHANASLKQAKTAISMLLNDTGKWPNGCDPEAISNPEVALNNAQSGILTQPVAGVIDDCEWTASEVANWNGPYMKIDSDRWGNSFYFDPDYIPYNSCATTAALAERAAILSFGPNGAGVNAYDCDDIFIDLQ